MTQINHFNRAVNASGTAKRALNEYKGSDGELAAVASNLVDAINDLLGESQALRLRIEALESEAKRK